MLYAQGPRMAEAIHPPLPRLLLLVVVALQAQQSCTQQCVIDGELPVRLGTIQASLPIPNLEEGKMLQRPCGEFFEGYVGFLEVQCLGGELTVDLSRCTPSSCPKGMTAPARISTFPETVYVESPQELPHGREAFVPCGLAIDRFKGEENNYRTKYMDQVRLECYFGKLQVDTSSCREAFADPSTVPSVWRIVNADYLPGTWRVFEVAFFTKEDCASGKLHHGTIIASSEDLKNEALKNLAFDRDLETAWSARCENGCRADTAWIGLAFKSKTDMVRCVQLRQSQVQCCGSRHVRLEVWDGHHWQTSQVWDTKGMQRDPHSFFMKVPKACRKGKPEGDGIVHDCDGPPVVGRQAGDICYAECKDGYYGDKEQFVCGEDGVFVGNNPTCYDLEGLTRIAGLVMVVGGALFLAHQYRFWCMYKKARLNGEGAPIPPAIRGRWLEHNGQNIWEVLAREHKKGEDRGLGEMIGAAMMDAEHGDDSKSKKEEMDHKQMLHGRGARGGDQAMAEVNKLVSVGGRVHREPNPSLHGLCDPCEDPDICWGCILCPICRIADTWHTLGQPSWLTYGRVVVLYLCCPWCFPCLNFIGRWRVRTTFEIPLEPHRDCIVHCCCPCVCSPCGICQEARLVDAPTRIHWSRRAQAHAQEVLFRQQSGE